ncbi:hypothetical protein [Hymenobacter sp. PAMC 26628]|uniref:hypothetical protein n=1 Tax=Hymenobacter sp. PAMC 26628 TaxID=1484118 RepID=UPI00077038E6|nr:hypothetical protein [Hymenobacter sp. PAMC 26628]AMJ66283.1 hypothetical protein AXW84_13175 [Hymenobacter sp. PAMC 26628]
MTMFACFFAPVPRRLVLAGALLLAATTAQAQGPLRQRMQAAKAERLSQLDNARIAFFTSRLALSQDQAQRFWPIYNEFIVRRRELNRTGRPLKREQIDVLTDQQIRDNITQTYNTRQQELNLEKDYFDKFQKVLSLRQVAQLLAAERDFTKEVIRRVAAAPSPAPVGPE